jgi:uncharacterized membrane protein YgcG
MTIDLQSVKDESGNEINVSQSRTADELGLRIGDPDVTFVGKKTYVISYHATHAIDQRKDIDELYWNVTGNSWPFPIAYSEATVHMPPSAVSVQSSCYIGATGSTLVCGHSEKMSDTEIYFRADTALNPSEGFTAAVGAHKGVFVPYSAKDDVLASLSEWKGVAVLFSMLMTLFVFLFVRWRKYGRDPKGTGVVVPQYDMPEHLSVLDMDVLRTQQLGYTAITAHIVELAVAGCIRIEEISTSRLSTILGAKDFMLHKLKGTSPFKSAASQKLLNLLFAEGKTKMQVSAAPSDFPQKLLTLMEDERTFMIENGYYSNLPKTGKGMIFIITVLVFASFQILPSFVHGVGWFPTSQTVFAAVVCIFGFPILSLVFQGLMPAKTVRGVEMKEYFDGLMLYITKAEKARLEFHNAPEKKPEHFDALLPAAMALGVTKIWAKEFEGIYTTPPDWYQGNSFERGFSASVFANSLDSFSQASNQAFAPASSGSGGSGGGGSSGGGGGGGGGGSW